MQNDNLQICKIQKMGNPFPEKIQRKVILTSSFDKNNFGKESFALGKEIHRNKRKKGY